MTGKEMVAAWHKWLASEEGKRCADGLDQYRMNRLTVAFYAGIEAAEAIWKDMPKERLKTL